MSWQDTGRFNQPVVARAWRKVLGEWLCWDQPRIESWMRLWDPELRDEGNPFFYHDPIMGFIVGLFISDDVAKRLELQRSTNAPSELVKLKWRLEDVFERRPDHSSVWDDDFDWKRARNTVERMLGEYGTSIPPASIVTSYEQHVRANPLTRNWISPAELSEPPPES